MAHPSVWRAEFVLRASERCFAPSARMLLSYRLRARADYECQRLLTVEKRACGGALERGEGLVLLETGGEVLSGLRIELVVLEPASAGEIRVSAALDSREKGVRRRT